MNKRASKNKKAKSGSEKATSNKPNELPKIQEKSKRIWKTIAGVVLLLASIVAVLDYFNINPFAKNHSAATDSSSTITISSTGQSGGITAHTLNYITQSQAVQLDSDIANWLKQNIPSTAMVEVEVEAGQERYRFALRLFDWMKANGYEYVTGVTQVKSTGPESGIIVQKNADDKYIIRVCTI